MYSTKPINESYALEEPGLEGLVLKRVLALNNNDRKVGEVIQIVHGRYDQLQLQGEFYYEELPSDIFFAKGLVHREHAYEPLHLSQPLKGIVLSKDRGSFYAKKERHLLIRPEEMNEVLQVIKYQKEHREEFADYRSHGNSGCGFIGYSYQPSGPDIDQEQQKFFRNGSELETIIKEIKVINDETHHVWNGEKISREFILDCGLEITMERNGLDLYREQEGIRLDFQQLPVLKKLIDLYCEH